MGLDAASDEVRNLSCNALGLSMIIVVGAVADVRSAVTLTGQAHRALALG